MFQTCKSLRQLFKDNARLTFIKESRRSGRISFREPSASTQELVNSLRMHEKAWNTIDLSSFPNHEVRICNRLEPEFQVAPRIVVAGDYLYALFPRSGAAVAKVTLATGEIHDSFIFIPELDPSNDNIGLGVDQQHDLLVITHPEREG